MTSPLTTNPPLLTRIPATARALIILILLALATQPTKAQDGTPLDWGAFNQHTDVTAWQGNDNVPFSLCYKSSLYEPFP